MKITLTPQTDSIWHTNVEGILMCPVSVTMEYPNEPDAYTAMALCAKALLAYGYYEKNIRECLDKELADEIFGTLRWESVDQSQSDIIKEPPPF